MSIVLAIETATHQCSVAVGRDGVLLAERTTLPGKQAHAASVSVFVAEVMAEAGLTLKDVHAVGVGIGPGSYTGLRIGLSTAKGLCHALDIPIIGVNTLTTLARAAGASATVQWPMIDARRMEVFTQEHDAQGQPIGDMMPVVITDEWIAAQGTIRVFGDGADKATAFWKDRPKVEYLPGIMPDARYLLPLAAERLRAGAVDDLAYLVPTYGKEANVTQPKKQGV
ncbi:MAG: tRNA (adenosine(37)-N6)-threonylcarbamoyltransferase complex dimerization subunit type 1 TsaB [Flavobacteriales bacterium]|nr:tRNA (adenosine(37)-N6)-threonylcarbamoyltransferase complex dimerization subunit type 1 TsaB [Flavobacteriales bacterium]